MEVFSFLKKCPLLHPLLSVIAEKQGTGEAAGQPVGKYSQFKADFQQTAS